MRELRYVGPGEDSDHLVVETEDGEDQFSLIVGDELRSALSTDLPRLGDIQSDPIEVSLRPREIQMRVRAGESPEAIADQAGIAIERVMRFAGPVLEERSRITDEAGRARARRSTPEGQVVVFRDSVDARFAAHGIDPSDVGWDSYRRDDGNWVVSATWHGGESERTARWAFSLGQRSITPMDETAADLLSDRPIRPIVRAVADPPPSTTSPTGWAPPQGPVVSPDELTGPLPPSPEVFDQNIYAPPSEGRGPSGGGRASANQAGGRADYDAPPLPLRLAEPVAAQYAPPAPSETDDQKAERARIPSWDDILLGVRRKRD